MIKRIPPRSYGSISGKTPLAAKSSLKQGLADSCLNPGSQKKVKMPSIAETEEQTEYGGHSHASDTKKKTFGNYFSAFKPSGTKPGKVRVESLASIDEPIVLFSQKTK